MQQRKTKLKIAIISGKLGQQENISSTIVADAAVKRGHKVFEFEAENLRYEEGKLLAAINEYPSKKKAEIRINPKNI